MSGVDNFFNISVSVSISNIRHVSLFFAAIPALCRLCFHFLFLKKIPLQSIDFQQIFFHVLDFYDYVEVMACSHYFYVVVEVVGFFSVFHRAKKVTGFSSFGAIFPVLNFDLCFRTHSSFHSHYYILVNTIVICP